MKLHLLSDLHLEFQPFQIPTTDADVVILAGDISVRDRGLTWAIQTSRPIHPWQFLPPSIWVT